MARRKAAIKREVLSDPLYGSQRLARLINVVMRRGKKSQAEMIVYKALSHVVERLKKEKHSGAPVKKHAGRMSAQMVPQPESLEWLDKAFDNIRPTVEVKSRRVGGATYQVPVEVNPERGFALAMRWLVKSAQERPEKTMEDRLAAEIIEASEGRGAAVKKKDEMHRMAKANQAFAHYRW